jgi:hypothetical protein
MPYTISLPSGADRAEVELTGRVTIEEAEAMARDLLLEHPDWRPGMQVLVRVRRGADISDLTLELYETRLAPLNRSLEHRRGESYRAAWVIEDEASRPAIWLWRETKYRGMASKVAVFSDEASALQWLADQSATARSESSG